MIGARSEHTQEREGFREIRGRWKRQGKAWDIVVTVATSDPLQGESKYWKISKLGPGCAVIRDLNIRIH